MKNFVYLSLITFSLMGCNPFSEFKPDSEKIVKSGWAKNTPKTPPQSLYCYKTLGEHTCYTHPLKNAEDRLTGNYENMEHVPEKQTLIEKVGDRFSEVGDKIVEKF